MKINIKKVQEGAIIPKKAHASDAGYDLYANTPGDVFILSGHTKVIDTGIAVAIPEGYFGAIFARSGLATKEGLRPANCVGVIDSNYRGEIKVAVHNDSLLDRLVSNGTRIAQLVIIPYLTADFEEVDTLEDTDRGEGGFGSSGVN